MAKRSIFTRRDKNRRKKRIIAVAVIVLLVALAVGTVYLIKNINSGEQANNKGLLGSIIDRFSSNNDNETEIEDNEIPAHKEEPNSIEPLPEDVKAGFNTSVAGYAYTHDAFWVQEVNSYKHRNEGEKIVFLTFDDGPSTESTEAILDILKSYDVKATFFVWAESLDNTEKEKDILVRTLKEGHAIGNHSYSHLYNYLYPNRTANYDNIMKDFEKANNKLKEVLGEDFETRVIRFPGGAMSWNGLKNVKDAFAANNIAYVDWNIDSTDASSNVKTKDQIVRAVKEGLSHLQSSGINQATILMHDTNSKKSTVEALPEIIEFLKEQGYSFKTLSTGQLSEGNDDSVTLPQDPS